jgi:hypothetical protein
MLKVEVAKLIQRVSLLGFDETAIIIKQNVIRTKLKKTLTKYLKTSDWVTQFEIVTLDFFESSSIYAKYYIKM